MHTIERLVTIADGVEDTIEFSGAGFVPTPSKPDPETKDYCKAVEHFRSSGGAGPWWARRARP
jgi:hypothetical protein